MWRFRIWLEKAGWKPILIGAAIVVAVLVAAGAAFALLSRGDDSSASPTTTAPEERTNLYYLRAVAPVVKPHGCSMTIRFIWKPAYHSIQYLGSDAVITKDCAFESHGSRAQLPVLSNACGGGR